METQDLAFDLKTQIEPIPWRKKDWIAIIIIAAALFVISIYMMIDQKFDIDFLLSGTSYRSNTILVAFFWFFSEYGIILLGLVWVLLILGSTCIIAWKSFQPLYLPSAFALGFSLIIQTALKYIVNKPRPYQVITEGLNPMDFHWSPSYPSGHCADTIAFTLIFILFASNKNIRALIVKMIFIALAFFISYSRVFLAVHWPSDIIGGVAVGLISVPLGLLWGNYYYKHGKFSRPDEMERFTVRFSIIVLIILILLVFTGVY